jgi:hypothetical protein
VLTLTAVHYYLALALAERLGVARTSPQSESGLAPADARSAARRTRSTALRRRLEDARRSPFGAQHAYGHCTSDSTPTSEKEPPRDNQALCAGPRPAGTRDSASRARSLRNCPPPRSKMPSAARAASVYAAFRTLASPSQSRCCVNSSLPLVGLAQLMTTVTSVELLYHFAHTRPTCLADAESHARRGTCFNALFFFSRNVGAVRRVRPAYRGAWHPLSLPSPAMCGPLPVYRGLSACARATSSRHSRRHRDA